MTDIFHEIRLEPFGRRVRAREGQTLFEAGVNSGILLRSDCGEMGTCGKCMVIVDRPEHLSPRTDTEQKILKKKDDTHRLACQARVEGPLLVTVPEHLLLRNEVYGKTGIKGFFPVDPAVKRLPIPAADLKATLKQAEESKSPVLSQADKISMTAKTKFSEDLKFEPALALRQLSDPGVHDGELTLIRHEDKGVVSVREGLHLKSLGLAFDIGTTTIAAYLADLETGEILVSRAVVNPQRRFGEDVITRISAVSGNKEVLGAQQALAVTAMNDLIESCLKAAKAKAEDIDDITIVGNTTMEHILFGLNPHSLGVFPYLPVQRAAMLTSASDLGLNLDPGVPVYFFPVISGFLGGDTLAAFLGDQARTREETTLIIDIGTNGELLLCTPDQIWATSCATGPALEGAQISCGMRASSGAISRAWVKDGRPVFETIGDAPPAGICGSGIIDVMAAMRQLGIVLETGNFAPEFPGVSCNDQGIGQKYSLPGTGINIQLKDIRQVQLAKAALFVGIESIIKKSRVPRVDRTVLTGAFGARFDWKKAVDIGMLPLSLCKGRVESAENLAGTGAIMALLDKGRRKEIEALAGQINFLDLSTEPDFVMEFAEATRFPELN
ncbi:ASKHA domain-containing protein [Desulfospira joergensenii]|uniref:ASKHA domain-containing protein n=1 Tax=Desulfospira joergensenii TaxID=53329 RepID=UPI0003B41DC2|nr:ASKHA domain-containing protein [Desulfospira joergensenii]